jgi:hypothetical protein
MGNTPELAGRSVEQKAAAGVLLAALGVLAARFGYGRAMGAS